MGVSARFVIFADADGRPDTIARKPQHDKAIKVLGSGLCADCLWS
jgi:hypothetical protein